MNSTISISETVSSAWRTVKSQIWVLVGLLIGFSIISFTLGLFANFTSVLGIVVYIVSLLVSFLFLLGYLKNIFQALDGEEPQFSAYGQQSRKLLKYIVAIIINTIIVAIGFCLLIIPGIYLSLRLQFFAAFIVDEDCGAIESLKRSWEITKGNEMSLLLIFLTMIGIGIIGFLLLGVGLFIAYPVLYTMYVIVYRRFNSPLQVLDEVTEE